MSTRSYFDGLCGEEALEGGGHTMTRARALRGDKSTALASPSASVHVLPLSAVAVNNDHDYAT